LVGFSWGWQGFPCLHPASLAGWHCWPMSCVIVAQGGHLIQWSGLVSCGIPQGTQLYHLRCCGYHVGASSRGLGPLPPVGGLSQGAGVYTHQHTQHGLHRRRSTVVPSRVRACRARPPGHRPLLVAAECVRLAGLPPCANTITFCSPRLARSPACRVCPRTYDGVGV
jgi:hypothetical protein